MPKLFLLFFALFINTRPWSARPHGFAHVFRLLDINTLTGMVTAADKAIREPAKFASEFARYKSLAVGVFLFHGNHAVSYGRFGFLIISAPFSLRRNAVYDLTHVHIYRKLSSVFVSATRHNSFTRRFVGNATRNLMHAFIAWFICFTSSPTISRLLAEHCIYISWIFNRMDVIANFCYDINRAWI